MNYFPLSKEHQNYKEQAEQMSSTLIGPKAEHYDATAQFPKESIEALQKEGWWSLRVPKEYGGLGADMLSTCLVVEEISKKCPSTAMCYKMHLEAVEAISRIPTTYQINKFVEPLSRGEVFAAAAGGESKGQSGRDWRSQAWPSTPLEKRNGNFILKDLRKSYVTSAGHATHYLIFCRVPGGRTEGPPDLLMLDASQVEWEVVGKWDGLGMRGNCSSPMIFNGRVPEENLLGIEIYDKSEPIMSKYMMPVLILTYGAAYLGIASGAFDLACIEGDNRFKSGSRRLDSPINQRRIAEMSAQIESARAFLHVAAKMADDERNSSLLPFIQAKVICSEVAVKVTQEIMTMFGGSAYGKFLPFERYFRDARAGLVMGMANDLAYENINDLLFPASQE